MSCDFTWLPTYNAINQWLKNNEGNQPLLVETLKSIGVEGLTDANEYGELLELCEFDPFSFFACLNRYKADSKRLEMLRRLHAELGLACALPSDVHGIPRFPSTRRARLFPDKNLRTHGEVALLWELFAQVNAQAVSNELFQRAINIEGVGKQKLIIAFFYASPERYLPLDYVTVSYLKDLKLDYSFKTFDEYLALADTAMKRLQQKPYEISYDAWRQKDHTDEQKKIGSVRTLLDILEKLNEGGRKNTSPISVFYRGHSSSKFELKPAIYRDEKILNDEDTLFKKLIARCPHEFKDCHSTFEKLVKMQHYSLPTRLLDITSNPLVALFFACKDDSQKDEDGRLYRFEVKESELKYFDSDAVSIVANLSRRPSSFSIENIRGEARDVFNNHEVIHHLLHDIRSEKAHFSAIIDQKHVEMVFCVRPKLDNPRIIRQEGAFFIFGIDGCKSEAARFDFEYKSYIVSKGEKAKILKQLGSLGINESTLFPEMEHVARHLRDEVYYKEAFDY